MLQWISKIYSHPSGCDFTALMQAINTCQTTLMGKIDTKQLEMGLIHKDMDNFRTWLTAVEHRMGDAEDLLRDHSTSLHTLTTKVRAFEYQAEDAENHNRRNNLCIIGLSGGLRGPQPCFLHRAPPPSATSTDGIFPVLRSRTSPQNAGSSQSP